MAGASPFEFTITPLFQGRHPSPAGTWAKLATACETAERFLEAHARIGNVDFLGISVLISTRSSRFGPGILLYELEVGAGETLAGDDEIERLAYAGVERLRYAGSRRERLLIESEFPSGSGEAG